MSSREAEEVGETSSTFLSIAIRALFSRFDSRCSKVTHSSTRTRLRNCRHKKLTLAHTSIPGSLSLSREREREREPGGGRNAGQLKGETGNFPWLNNIKYDNRLLNFPFSYRLSSIYRKIQWYRVAPNTGQAYKARKDRKEGRVKIIRNSQKLFEDHKPNKRPYRKLSMSFLLIRFGGIIRRVWSSHGETRSIQTTHYETKWVWYLWYAPESYQKRYNKEFRPSWPWYREIPGQ